MEGGVRWRKEPVAPVSTRAIRVTESPVRVVGTSSVSSGSRRKKGDDYRSKDVDCVEIAPWSNGKASDFDSENLGSTPRGASKIDH